MARTKNELELLEEGLRDFDRSLPMSLLKAREAVMREFLPSLRSHQLSPEQWRVIRALVQEDGLELAEISLRCFLLAPSLSRISQNLEKRNIVERKNVDSDQRRSKLFLTKEGRKLFETLAPESEQQYLEIANKFGEEKLDTLYELLSDLVNVLNKP
ncbi:MAG TPA: homoprotocatechuate degradation operon regulator HpaR [Gammaproteobacteria bacterium]|nr:homoprotocatechuate degradation operon regulator HpaR [Gammaproteobacteria bacterium]